MMRLSFILPCYNVAPYIARCIDSIENQDMPQSDYEVICVDDCSKDNTVEVIKESQKQYDNIRLICHKENKTAGGARNTGLDAAQGEYIWFVDPDDCIAKNVTTGLYELAKNNDVDILIFDYSIIDHQGMCHKTQPIPNSDEVLTGQQFFLRHCPQKRMAEVASVWRNLYKRVFCNTNKLRFPEIKSSQDVVFAWTSFLKSRRVMAVAKTAYHCYGRPDSTTGRIGRLRALNVISSCLLYSCEIIKLIEINPIDEQYVRDIKFEARDSINTDSRKVLKMPLREQHVFYKEMQKYSDKIAFMSLCMNRKTKHIFNYKLPYVLWQSMIWGYKLHDKLFAN